MNACSINLSVATILAKQILTEFEDPSYIMTALHPEMLQNKELTLSTVIAAIYWILEHPEEFKAAQSTIDAAVKAIKSFC